MRCCNRGAQVDLDRADGSQLSHMLSDGSGTFQFKNVSPGSYVIDVQRAGFRETKVKAITGGTNRTPLRIVLPVAGVEEPVAAQPPRRMQLDLEFKF
jgi:Carboxypeptidase regulatory-like domain